MLGGKRVNLIGHMAESLFQEVLHGPTRTVTHDRVREVMNMEISFDVSPLDSIRIKLVQGKIGKNFS